MGMRDIPHRYFAGFETSFPRLQTVTLEPGVLHGEFLHITGQGSLCITVMPVTQCPCGLYRIQWLREDARETTP